MGVASPTPPASDAAGALSAAEQRFERTRRTIGVFAGPLIFLVVSLAPMPSLSAPAHRLAAIVALVVTWWVTEAFPIPATALIGAALLVTNGVTNAQAAFAPFASPTIYLFVGSFMLAEALAVHGLDQRIAMRLLSVPWVGRSGMRVRFAFGALAIALSMWMSNTATAAMLLPVAVGLLGPRGSSSSASAARGLLLTLAYSASIGGVATPVGTPPNLIAIGMLERLAHVEIDFFRWMVVGVPVSLGMYAALTLLMRWFYPVSEWASNPSVLAAAAPRREVPSWSRAQTNCLIAFALAVTLWVTPGVLALLHGTTGDIYRLASARLDEGAVAVLAAGLLFVLPVNWRRREFTLTWGQATRIDWGTIVLFGGGLSLGQQMFETGLAGHIGQALVSASGATSLWTITAVMTAVAVLTTEVTSNTAATNMLVPVALAVAQATGVNPVPPAMGIAFGASLAYMLPISTPPNAIVYGTGLIPITAMIKCGLLLDLLSILIVLAALRLICPLVGLA